jgi:hypothetical protein
MRFKNIIKILPSPRNSALFLLLFFSILTLYGCAKPVDYEAFFEDEKIISLIYNSKIGKFIPDVEYSGIEDIYPQLMLNNKLIIPKEDGTITIYKNHAPQSAATITVTNEDSFTKIDWYCNDTTPLTLGVSGENNEIFTASTANEPFINAGKYMVTVAGLAKENNKSYDIRFYIEVES